MVVPGCTDATIIIPQFRGAPLTLAAIRSLRHYDPHRCPILVVDDGSAAADIGTLQRAALPHTEILPRPHRGITAAWNAAAARVRRMRMSATPSYLVFLNNDTLTTGPWLDRLLAPLRTAKARMTGIQFREERRLPPAACRGLPTTRFLEGWCFALRQGDLADLGGFDESLRLYFSDTDLQCRLLARQNAPGALTAVPALPLRHIGHATANQQAARRRIWAADRRRFCQKWSNAGRAAPAAVSRLQSGAGR